jgi:hypothetical protein
MDRTTTHRYGTAAAGVARARVGYLAVCVHTAAANVNVAKGSWSIPSFMTTAHKPEPRLLVTTS